MSEASVTESLLSKYTAPDTPIVVVLPDGEELTFRALTSYSDLQQFLKGAKLWVTEVRKQAPHPTWVEHIPADDETLHAAFTIAELSIEPKFSHLDALKLCGAGWLVLEIMAQLDAKKMRLRLDESSAVRVIDEKKD